MIEFLRPWLPGGGGSLPLPSLPDLAAAAAKAAELAWHDGYRTGLVAGLMTGFLAGVIVAALLLRR